MKKFAPCSTFSYAALYTYHAEQHQQRSTTTRWPINSGSGSPTVQRLDISTMDPAEALVFWLGGFPAPCGNIGSAAVFDAVDRLPFQSAESVHAGSVYQPTAPLSFIQSRKTKLFDFDETRLVDNDMDGWLEYVPYGVSTTMGGLRRMCISMPAATPIRG